MKKTKIALSLLALVGAANVLAQSAPNPLMRPAPQAAQAPVGGMRGQSPLAPPGANDMSMLMGGQSSQDGLGKNDKTDERVKSAQTAMARYNVVAVQGDTAVLRVTATSAPAAAQSAGPSMGWASQGGNAAGSAGQSATAGAADAAYGVLPSMVVKHKQRAVVQDVEVMADVQGGQVVLRTLDGKRAIYAGRLDGNGGRQMRGFVFTSPDAAYTARQSPPVSKSAAGSTTAGNGGTGAGAGVGLGSSLPSTNSN